MKRIIGIGLLAAAIFVAGAALDRKAEASVVGKYGYVCNLAHYPFSGPSYGNFGMISLTVYSGPNCSGTFVTYVSIYSTGATGKGAATTYDQPTFLRLMQLFQTRTISPANLLFEIDDTSLGLFYSTF